MAQVPRYQQGTLASGAVGTPGVSQDQTLGGVARFAGGASQQLQARATGLAQQVGTGLGIAAYSAYNAYSTVAASLQAEQAKRVFNNRVAGESWDVYRSLDKFAAKQQLDLSNPEQWSANTEAFLKDYLAQKRRELPLKLYQAVETTVLKGSRETLKSVDSKSVSQQTVNGKSMLDAQMAELPATAAQLGRDNNRSGYLTMMEQLYTPENVNRAVSYYSGAGAEVKLAEASNKAEYSYVMGRASKFPGETTAEIDSGAYASLTGAQREAVKSEARGYQTRLEAVAREQQKQAENKRKGSDQGELLDLQWRLMGAQRGNDQEAVAALTDELTQKRTGFSLRDPAEQDLSTKRLFNSIGLQLVGKEDALQKEAIAAAKAQVAAANAAAAASDRLAKEIQKQHYRSDNAVEARAGLRAEEARLGAAVFNRSGIVDKANVIKDVIEYGQKIQDVKERNFLDYDDYGNRLTRYREMMDKLDKNAPPKVHSSEINTLLRSFESNPDKKAADEQTSMFETRLRKAFERFDQANITDPEDQRLIIEKIYSDVYGRKTLEQLIRSDQ